MSINFLTFVTSADFSSNVYNYNSLFQALMVDVGLQHRDSALLYRRVQLILLMIKVFTYKRVVIQLHIILIFDVLEI